MNALSPDEISSLANRMSNDLFTRINHMRAHGWRILYFWSPPTIERPEKFRFVKIGMKTFWKKRDRVP